MIIKYLLVKKLIKFQFYLKEIDMSQQFKYDFILFFKKSFICLKFALDFFIDFSIRFEKLNSIYKIKTFFPSSNYKCFISYSI